MTEKEILVGFDKETKRTYRYTTPGDMPQTFYFPKSWFNGTPPQNLTVRVDIP